MPAPRRAEGIEKGVQVRLRQRSALADERRENRVVAQAESRVIEQDRLIGRLGGPPRRHPAVNSPGRSAEHGIQVPRVVPAPQTAVVEVCEEEILAVENRASGLSVNASTAPCASMAFISMTESSVVSSATSFGRRAGGGPLPFGACKRLVAESEERGAVGIAALEHPLIDVVDLVEPGLAADTDSAITEKLGVALFDIRVDSDVFPVDIYPRPVREGRVCFGTMESGLGGELVELPRHPLM